MRSLIFQLSIHKLEVFCTVAELGSVSRAAERMGIAQPVVSAHLKSLAQKLGTPLTVRHGRHLGLTEAGQRVHHWAQEMVSRTRELERELAESRRGLVGRAAIGASMTVGSYVLPALLVGFHDLYPKGEISVRVTTPQLVTDAVHAGDCDFAFTILDPRHETAGLEVEQVHSEKMVLLASRTMPIADRLESLDDLVRLPFVAAQRNTARRELEDHLLGQLGVHRERIEMEFGHPEALKQAVRAGAGIAFFFKASVRDELASGLLREISVDGLALTAPVFQVWRKGKRLSTFQRALMDHLARTLPGKAAAMDAAASSS